MPEVEKKIDLAEKPNSNMESDKDEGPDVEIESCSTVELKKELGLSAAVSIVVGSTIGSGIFISPSVALKAAGSVGMTLTAWVAVGLITMLGSLCLAELGTLIPKSGGTYTYIKMGLGNYMAFVYIVQNIIFGTPGGMVVVLGTCSKYLVAMFPTCGTPALMEKSLTATIIVVFTSVRKSVNDLVDCVNGTQKPRVSCVVSLVGLYIVNVRSSKLAARVMVITTNAKVIALVIIIVGGIVSMIKGMTSELGTGFEGSNASPSSLTMTFFACSWAYSGGDNLNNVVEEIKNPARNIPLAHIFGMLLIITVYLMTNISYLAVLTRDEILTSPATAVSWGEIVLGAAVVLIPISVAISTLGAGSTYFFSGSRVVYTAARDRNIPDVMSFIEINNLTPMVATTLTMALALVLVMPSDVGDLINYIEFLSAFFRGCVFVGLLRFRYTLKHAERSFKVPLILPIFMVLLQVFLFVTPLVQNPDLGFVWAACGIFGISTVLYVIFIKFKVTFPFYDSFVAWTQLILQVTPPPDFDDDLIFKTKTNDDENEKNTHELKS